MAIFWGYVSDDLGVGTAMINECMEWGMQDDVKCVGVRCVNLRWVDARWVEVKCVFMWCCEVIFCLIVLDLGLSEIVVYSQIHRIINHTQFLYFLVEVYSIFRHAKICFNSMYLHLLLNCKNPLRPRALGKIINNWTNREIQPAMTRGQVVKKYVSKSQLTNWTFKPWGAKKTKPKKGWLNMAQPPTRCCLLFSMSGWWFQTFCIFHDIYIYILIYGIIFPIDCHIFQRGRSTTNQLKRLNPHRIPIESP